MSDEQENGQNTEPVPAPSGARGPYLQMREEIAAEVTKQSPTVRGLVVTELATKELERRRTAVLNVVGRIETQTKELRKLEGQGVPSNVDLKGNRVGDMSYTKEQFESIKKVREELQKLEGALEKAFAEKPDFQRVLELGK